MPSVTRNSAVSRRWWPTSSGRSGPEISLGRGGLSATRRTPHRLQDRRRDGLRYGQVRGRVRAEGQQLGDADRRACFQQAVQVEDRRGRSGQCRQRRENDAENFITKDGFGITDTCRTYLEPLIKGEDYPPYKDGMPQYVQLKNVAVPKKLKSKFKLKSNCRQQRGLIAPLFFAVEPPSAKVAKKVNTALLINFSWCLGDSITIFLASCWCLDGSKN